MDVIDTIITLSPIIITILVFLLLAKIGILLESKDFNNGYCKNCNTKLILFDHDSQGGRGYKCTKCDYTTWVSWPIVDKNF